jgi:hypothetical protein
MVHRHHGAEAPREAGGLDDGLHASFPISAENS